MKLTIEQLKHYQEEGYLLLPEWFSPQEAALMQAQLPAVAANDAIETVLQEDNKTFRASVGVHNTNKFFQDLIRHPRLLELGRQILKNDVFIRRSSIVWKPAFSGGAWSWHQDSSYGDITKSLPSSMSVKIVVFLNEVNEFNGPMYLIRGSHKEGVFERVFSFKEMPVLDTYRPYPNTISTETITRLVQNKGIIAPKGLAGSVLLFNTDTLHSSPPNNSPFDRQLFHLNYTSSECLANFKGKAQPEFIAECNSTPLEPLSEKEALCLFSANTKDAVTYIMK